MSERSPLAATTPAPRLSVGWTAALAVVVFAGLWLRIDGIGERALSHPENFAPGLDVPKWVRFPPPRHDVMSVLRGTLIDGHPPTYFVALLPWIDAFGASLVSLRMPSALLGALSIALVFFVARRESTRWTALLAAGLLALHGHHIFWSQLARMYVPAACLALLSTLFLLRLRERGRALDLWAFFAFTTLALCTQLYAWPFVFAQMIGALLLDARERRAPSALRAQVAAVVASIWVAQLSIYQNPPSRWHGPASEYFQLGYLSYSRAPFFGDRPSSAFDGPWLLALGVALLLAASFTRRASEIAPDSLHPVATPRLPRWFELCIVVVSTAVLLAFAAFAPPRARVGAAPLWVLSVAPVAISIVYTRLERWISRLVTAPPAWLARVAALDVPLSWQLAVVPAVCMMTVSLARGVFVARGTILFLPFFSIAIAHGIAALFRVRVLGALALALVVALHVVSVSYFRAAVSTPRDDAGLARQILAELRPTDLILVRNNYAYPPLLYYLRDVKQQCVPDEQPELIRNAPPGTRVWLVHFEHPHVRKQLLALVADRKPTRRLQAPGATAVLYEDL